jgi:hypothetical protein
MRLFERLAVEVRPTSARVVVSDAHLHTFTAGGESEVAEVDFAFLMRRTVDQSGRLALLGRHARCGVLLACLRCVLGRIAHPPSVALRHRRGLSKLRHATAAVRRTPVNRVVRKVQLRRECLLHKHVWPSAGGQPRPDERAQQARGHTQRGHYDFASHAATVSHFPALVLAPDPTRPVRSEPSGRALLEAA